MPKFALLLVICFLLCSCSREQEKTFETETESANISETASEASSVSSAEATETDTTPIIAETKITAETTTETDIEYGEYVYSPPQEVLDTHFYSDNIEVGFDFNNCEEVYLPMPWYDVCQEPDYEKYYTDFKEVIPPLIVDDIMNFYPLDKDYLYDTFFTGIKYMLHDMNNDGYDDYIITGVRFSPYLPECYVHKIYLTNVDGSFTPIIWDCLPKSHPVQYILKTETNGLKDIMVLHNTNYPVITYDGSDSYTKFQYMDEDHTFLTAEILPNNILHLNMNISVIGAAGGEYYTAIKFADNPYLKNNVLYTCYPDGTPRSYIEKPFGESLPTDFSPSREGYDFYVEVNEDMRSEFDYYKDLLEIKYIAVNDDNNH